VTPAAFVGGIDLGATNLRVAIADGDGSIVGRSDRTTPEEDGHTVTAAVTSTLRRAADCAGVEPTRLRSIGVASVGPLDRKSGVVLDPPNLRGVRRIELQEALETVAGCPVVLRNDAIAGLRAERTAGAPENTVYLTLSTGIGAGACVDGHVLGGRGGNAAEMGHIVVDPRGALECNCGGSGHWEAYCSGTALPNHAAHVAQTTSLSTALSPETLRTPEIVEMAETDDLASRTLTRVARFNAYGLAALVHAFAPSAIRVGGTLGKEAWEYVVEPAVEQLPAYLAVDTPTVRLTDFDDPALRGALIFARDAVST
jgi:glucokinase